MADDEVEEQMQWRSRRTPPKRPRHRHSSGGESSSYRPKLPTTYDECTQTLLQVPPDTPESAALKLLHTVTHPGGSNLPGGPETPAAGSSLRAVSTRSGAPPSEGPTRSAAVAKEESGPRSSETMIGMMKPKDAATGAQSSASSASKEHAKPAVFARSKVSPAGQGSGSQPSIPTTDQTVAAAAAAASALGVGWRTPEMSGCAKFCHCMFTTAVPSEVASAVVDVTASVDPRSQAHRRRAEAPGPESFKFEEVPPELQEEGPPAEPRKFFWSRGVNTTLTYICGGRIEKHAAPPPTPPTQRPAEKEESHEEMDVGDGALETGSEGASKE